MMDLDDPTKPEFASWRSYEHFARLVRHRRRYVWGAEETAFLETVLATNRGRDVEIPEGMVLNRAQRGIDWKPFADAEGNVIDDRPDAYGPTRMKPRLGRANEGRANPAGIPVLYLGTTERTAVSEVRPWVGARISLAQFRVRRRLKAIDLSIGHGKSTFSEVGFKYLDGEQALGAEIKERAVWIDIDNAFSRPVTVSDDSADYVPTQILAELFRDAGYDAIVYKSQFDVEGLNIVLFDVDDADAINAAPYEITAVEVSFKECGDRWYSANE